MVVACRTGEDSAPRVAEQVVKLFSPLSHRETGGAESFLCGFIGREESFLCCCMVVHTAWF